MTEGLERTFRGLNLHLLRRTEGPYGMPKIEPCRLTLADLKGCELAGFDKAINAQANRENQILHFYLHDFFFERIWTNPERYLELARKYRAVIMPDFSIMTDTPLPLQIFNCYRSKLVASYWQSQGVEIIPSPAWGDGRSYEWAFDGLPIGGLYANSTTGADLKTYTTGFEKLLRWKRPAGLLMLSNQKINTAGIPTAYAKMEREGKKGHKWVIQEAH